MIHSILFLSYPCIYHEDGERCGQTLLSIFENADNPDLVVIGLAEQTAPEDKFCLEMYCNNYGKLELLDLIGSGDKTSGLCFGLSLINIS